MANNPESAYFYAVKIAEAPTQTENLMVLI